MANILILGGGFAGLVAAEELAASLDGGDHQITLVSPNRQFTFYPGLVHLAFGRYDLADVTFDLQAKLKDLGVRFVRSGVIRINPDQRSVDVAGDDFTGKIAFDYQVIAMGRRLATEKISGFFDHSYHLLGTKAALRFGEAVDKFRAGRIIVGMCPGARLPVPVCETAFSLSRKFEQEIKDGAIRVSVVFPGSLEDAFGGARLHKELETAFAKHNIDVHYDIPINEITDSELRSTERHAIGYEMAMLVPPFRGQSFLRGLGMTDEEDFVNVDGAMRVHGLERAYAVGDVVAFSGPKFAHMAVRQAKVAAENLAAEIRGKEPEESYYHEIATIIDSGGPDSIYLHYGIWDDEHFRVSKGRFWSWAKTIHDEAWQSRHLHQAKGSDTF